MKRIVFACFILALLCLGAGCSRQPEAVDTPTVAPTESVSAQFRSDALEKYVIVYGEENPDYYDLAYRLNDHIYEKYGVLLMTACDTRSAPAQYEILIGDTNRCDAQGRVMEYAVTVEDGQFRIHTGGSFSAEKAVDFLCEQVFTGQELILEPGQYYQTSLLTTAQPVTEGVTARIMTANLLADAFADGSYNKAHYRAEIFAGMLLSYTPDVVGLQEVDESWGQALDLYLEKLQKTHGIRYARLLATWEDKTNYTCLLYRADKFQPENSGISVFSWWENETFRHDYHMRNISWAEFSSLEDPAKSFIVANTHWSYRTEHADGNTYLTGADGSVQVNELRLQCKDETNDFLSQLQQQYPQTPIFLTGDFNTSLLFFTESGWTPQGFRIISQEAKACNAALSLVPTEGHFDHLFGAGDYQIGYYAFFNDANYHSLLTDHPFAYTDLTF